VSDEIVTALLPAPNVANGPLVAIAIELIHMPPPSVPPLTDAHPVVSREYRRQYQPSLQYVKYSAATFAYCSMNRKENSGGQRTAYVRARTIQHPSTAGAHVAKFIA
jgi:hypothetical protein